MSSKWGGFRVAQEGSCILALPAITASYPPLLLCRQRWTLLGWLLASETARAGPLRLTGQPEKACIGVHRLKPSCSPLRFAGASSVVLAEGGHCCKINNDNNEINNEIMR